eukprot:TRINITY_DN67467_c6_g3_i1.p1 TRINITY_DN67467_c6_g3~~TRINITY_DN67467_c6_g3_i1.p1  ORF type:complete len:1196 (-),score=174.65 TRINITY_DN67467_c6_g3_i1:124-3375(-)
MKKEHNVHMQAIAVGDVVSKRELDTLASRPFRINTHRVESFSQLNFLAQNMSSFCQEDPNQEPHLIYDTCNCDIALILNFDPKTVTPQNWEAVQNFSLYLVRTHKDSINMDRTRIAIIHQSAQPWVPLTSNITALEDSIKSMGKGMGAFDQYAALQLASQEFVNNTRGLGNCRVVYFLTNTIATYAPQLDMVAHTLKRTDMALVKAIGIGPNVHRNELSVITSTSSGYTADVLTNYGQLRKTQSTLFDYCTVVTPEPVIAEPTPDLVSSLCQCDYMLVLDASGSITPKDWQTVKDFAEAFVVALEPFMALGASRVGIIPFATYPKVELPLTFDSHLALETIGRINKTSGITRAAAALEKATQELWAHRRTAMGNCQRVVYLSSSKAVSDQKAEVIAHQLKQVAHVSAIGIGMQVSEQFLSLITTAGDYTMLSNFNGLPLLVNQLLGKCNTKAGVQTATPNIDRNDCHCDVILAFDSSGSIWDSQWVHIKEFARIVVNNMRSELKAGTARIGLLQFSNGAKLVQGLTDDAELLLGAINAMSKTEGSTRTWLAYELAMQEFNQNNRGLTSCKTVKLITDGNSNIPSNTEKAAHNLKAIDGVVISVIGVGRLVTDFGELRNCVSTPVQDNLFFVDDFTGLEEYAHLLSDKCVPPQPFDFGCECDTMLVVDVSGSMTNEELDSTKTWMTNIIKGMAPRLTSGASRIGIVTFASVAQLAQNITRSYTTLLTAVRNIQKTNGVTRTNLAINLAAKVLVDNQRFQGSCKSIKLVLSGRSTYPSHTAAAAQYAKTKLGINIETIAIGSLINQWIGDMRATTSPPQGLNLKILNDYHELPALGQLVAKQCYMPPTADHCNITGYENCVGKKLPKNGRCPKMLQTIDCATKYHCNSISKVLCGTTYNTTTYNNCTAQKFCKKIAHNSTFSPCDETFYKQCVAQANKNKKSFTLCEQLNKYAWCSNAAACPGLSSFLCLAADENHCPALTACKGVIEHTAATMVHDGVSMTSDLRTAMDSTLHDLHGHGFSIDDKSTSSSWVVIALGCATALLGIGLVVVVAKYRAAMSAEQDATAYHQHDDDEQAGEESNLVQ